MIASVFSVSPLQTPDGSIVDHGGPYRSEADRWIARFGTDLVSIACPPRASMPIKGGCCSADRGTWTFRAGTGVHAGFSGGGAFAAVGLQSGIVVARQEGYLTKR